MYNIIHNESEVHKRFMFSYSCRILSSNRVRNSIFVIYLNCVHSYLIVKELQMTFSYLLVEKYVFFNADC